LFTTVPNFRFRSLI